MRTVSIPALTRSVFASWLLKLRVGRHMRIETSAYTTLSSFLRYADFKAECQPRAPTASNLSKCAEVRSHSGERKPPRTFPPLSTLTRRRWQPSSSSRPPSSAAAAPSWTRHITSGSRHRLASSPIASRLGSTRYCRLPGCGTNGTTPKLAIR